MGTIFLHFTLHVCLHGIACLRQIKLLCAIILLEAFHKTCITTLIDSALIVSRMKINRIE
ncbi:hypothetical protein EVA_06138 [gut metagenome]|uniref:Uncharacterized protein n=1 Tax=gut metagenome TaxID=749906 RepID=J9GST4_9ZZZZ